MIGENRLVIQNYSEFMKEQNDLLTLTNEIEGLRNIKLDDLGEIAIEPEILSGLSWLISE